MDGNGRKWTKVDQSGLKWAEVDAYAEKQTWLLLFVHFGPLWSTSVHSCPFNFGLL